LLSLHLGLLMQLPVAELQPSRYRHCHHHSLCTTRNNCHYCRCHSRSNCQYRTGRSVRHRCPTHVPLTHVSLVVQPLGTPFCNQYRTRLHSYCCKRTCHCLDHRRRLTCIQITRIIIRRAVDAGASICIFFHKIKFPLKPRNGPSTKPAPGTPSPSSQWSKVPCFRRAVAAPSQSAPVPWCTLRHIPDLNQDSGR